MTSWPRTDRHAGGGGRGGDDCGAGTLGDGYTATTRGLCLTATFGPGFGGAGPFEEVGRNARVGCRLLGRCVPTGRRWRIGRRGSAAGASAALSGPPVPA